MDQSRVYLYRGRCPSVRPGVVSCRSAPSGRHNSIDRVVVELGGERSMRVAMSLRRTDCRRDDVALLVPVFRYTSLFAVAARPPAGVFSSASGAPTVKSR